MSPTNSPSSSAAPTNCWSRARCAQKLARRQATADQARPRPDRAGHPPRAHGRAQQDAPDAGPRAPGDLPDRRLHVDDRRPVRPQRHAPAAVARADRGQREDVPRAGVEGARPRAHRDPLQLGVERAARRRGHDQARRAVHGRAAARARRLREALRRPASDRRARTAVPADAGLRLGRARSPTSSWAAPTRSSTCWSAASCSATTGRSRSAS